MSARDGGRRRGMGFGEVCVVVGCAVYPSLHGAFWAVPLTGAAVAAALAGWRLVRLRQEAAARDSR